MPKIVNPVINNTVSGKNLRNTALAEIYKAKYGDNFFSQTKIKLNISNKFAIKANPINAIALAV